MDKNSIHKKIKDRLKSEKASCCSAQNVLSFSLLSKNIKIFFSHGATTPIGVVFYSPLALASSYTRFLDHSQRRATVGRTPLNE